jgi:hypothetical protein
MVYMYRGGRKKKDGRTREENRRVAQYAAPSSFFFHPNAAFIITRIYTHIHYLYIHHVIPFKLVFF